nr:hypothetical protein [Tanacetum cinerariifolium]
MQPNNMTEQVCLSGADIYDDPSLLRFYQNDDFPPRGNNRRKEEGESGPNWVVGRKFEDLELAPVTPYPTPPKPTTADYTEGMVRKEGPEGKEPNIIQTKETPRPPTFYHPSKSSSVPFPSRLKKQKKDDDDERLLSIFRQIYHFWKL